MRHASVPKSVISLIRRRLLRWFDRNRRDLPWRHNRDPYCIWVSEVMLQQTTVATVRRRFEQFLRRFPTVVDLAAANEQEVLHAWQGLGYYRRARHLHAASKQLVCEYDGRLPDDPAVWARLPGVGRYILGAVLSQAFNRRLPIVETNSQRLLCRLFAQSGDPKSGPVKEWLWRTAEILLPTRRSGDFNQGLMELGALVCTPTDPKCGQCPLQRICAARRKGTQHTIPLRAKRERTTEIREVAVVVRKAGRVLLARRPDNARWSGMWEFPHGELARGESPTAAAARVIQTLTGLRITLGQELIIVRHGVTRFRITMTCLEAKHRAGSFDSSFYVEGRWFRPSQLNHVPISSPQWLLVRTL